MKLNQTILGDDISFRGNLHVKGPLTINGLFKGYIQTPDHLVVGASAKIEGDVDASDISIDGYVKGNIFASKRIKFQKGSHVIGDLRTPDLQIDSGSRFQGTCVMD